MATFLADGIGGTLGDSLALEVGYIGLGSVYYVSSETGTDAVTHGRSREAPFATIPYAVAFASTGSTIVVLGDHNETMVAGYDIDKPVVIVGEGSSAGSPTAVWGHDALGSDEVLVVSGDNVEIRNIRFTTGEQSITTDRITWSGDNGRVRGCRFECSVSESTSMLMVTGDHMILEATTFISVGVSAATAPVKALDTANSGLTRFSMRDCVVSGGTTGWSSTSGAVHIQQGVGLELRIEGMSLLLGSDIAINTGVNGFVSVPTSTGGGQVRNI